MIFALLLAVLALGFHALLCGWWLSVFPRHRRYRGLFWGATCALLGLVFLARWLSFKHVAAASGLLALLILELAVVGLSALPITFMRIVAECIAWSHAKLRRRAPKASANEHDGGRRQTIERLGGVAILTGSGAALGWGMVRGRHAFRVEEVAIRIAGLPRTLDGYTIAQISDLHGGPFVGDEELASGLEYVRRAKPDLLVATGDLVDHDPDFARLVANAVARVKPRDGAFAILGNHDYYAGASAVREAFESAGVTMLVNASSVIRRGDGGGFALVGFDDVWAPRAGGPGPLFGRATAGLRPDVPLVALSHQPQTVDFWAGRVALQLSGHTHGGQINLGWSPARALLPYIAGRYDVRGTALWVNRGFGTAGLPSRIGAPPEITRVVLVSA